MILSCVSWTSDGDVNNTLKTKWICLTFLGCVLTNNKALIITEVLSIRFPCSKVYEEVLLVGENRMCLIRTNRLACFPPIPTGKGEKGLILQILSFRLEIGVHILCNIKLCIGYVLVKHLRFRTELSRFLTSKAHVGFVLDRTKHNKHLE